MPEAISNTSPLAYLHRAGHLDWLGDIFDEVWVPQAVLDELRRGRHLGYKAPHPETQPWIRVREPGSLSSSWLALDLGPGELTAMALALENPSRIVLLDDQLARRTAVAAGLSVWGTLRLVLEAKDRGLTPAVAPLSRRCAGAGCGSRATFLDAFSALQERKKLSLLRLKS